MTLPFNDEKGARKFQCFVCGNYYENFDLFKNHITENHELGLEYVICPLQRCQAPVRDLRMHFKCKHPKDKLPPVSGPVRAIIWKDYSPKTGKMKTKKPKFREGWFDSKKMKKKMHYRSGMEASLYEIIETIDDIIAYEVELIEIPYAHEGTIHKYIPDLFVFFKDGRKEVWEVKPQDQLTLKKNEDKWYAAREACKARGWGFEVITETTISKMKKRAKKR